MAFLEVPARPCASSPRPDPLFEPIEGLVLAGFATVLLAITLLQGSLADQGRAALRDTAVCHPRSFPSPHPFLLAFH